MTKTRKFFHNVTTIEELKKEYRTLCKKYHPDLNKEDTNEIMKEINNEYEYMFKILSTEETIKQGHDVDDNFREVINALIKFDDITIEVIGFWVWVSGNTYPIKDYISSLGLWYSGKHKKWVFNGNEGKKKGFSNKLTYDDIKNKHGYSEVKKGNNRKSKISIA